MRTFQTFKNTAKHTEESSWSNQLRGWTPCQPVANQLAVGVLGTPACGRCGPGTSSGLALNMLNGLAAAPSHFLDSTSIDTHTVCNLSAIQKLLYVLAPSTNPHTSYIDRLWARLPSSQVSSECCKSAETVGVGIRTLGSRSSCS